MTNFTICVNQITNQLCKYIILTKVTSYIYVTFMLHIITILFTISELQIKGHLKRITNSYGLIICCRKRTKQKTEKLCGLSINS